MIRVKERKDIKDIRTRHPDIFLCLHKYFKTWYWYSKKGGYYFGLGEDPPTPTSIPKQVNGVLYWYDRSDKIKEMLK